MRLERPRLAPLRSIVLVGCSLLCLAAGFADASARLTSPQRRWTAAELDRFDAAWLHVKFVEGSDPVAAARTFVPTTAALAKINARLVSLGVQEIRPSFPIARETARAWKSKGEARSPEIGPDLSLWYDLRVDGGRAGVAAAVNSLMESAEVEIAHPAAIPELASAGAVAAPASTTPDFSQFQTYLGATPLGLDAVTAWSFPGGRGAGVKFIDVELAWTEDHEDFDPDRMFYVGGAAQNTLYEPHGTAVLGEIIGRHNGYGVDGFAPDVDWGVVAVTEAEWPTVPHRFFEAMENLGPGDCWLIELQMYPPGRDATPMEYLQINYDVIWTSSWSRGVICVEAGANGGQDLDHPQWEGAFDRSQRDSGAILVAAGTPQGRMAEFFTNYGSRMDAHAWGTQIVTTGYGDLYSGGTLQTRYSAGFSGTSGASPMVAGAVLCLEGIARAAGGDALSPEVIRALLTETGVPALDPVKQIGPRPDLASALVAVLDPVGVSISPANSATPSSWAAPNPFRESIELRWANGGSEATSLRILDTAGRSIRRVLVDSTPGAVGAFRWDGRDDRGRVVAAGVYLASFDSNGSRRPPLRLIRVR